MVWIALESWVDHTFNGWVFFKEVSDMISTSCALNNSKFECFNAFQSIVAVKNAWTSSKTNSSKENFIFVLLIFEDTSSHNKIGVTSNKLGQTMEGNISS